MAGKHVLVVDDERAMQEILSALLQTLGHVAQTVSSGAEALRKLESTVFHLVLLDLHMPGMKGDQLAQEIKQRDPTLPVILVTGGRPQSVASEIDAVLLKPFSLSQLQDAIAAAVSW